MIMTVVCSFHRHANPLRELFSHVDAVYNRRLNNKVDQGSLVTGVRNRIALVVFAVLAFGLLLLAIFNDKGVLQVHSQSQKLAGVEAEIRKIEAENQALSDEIQALRTDPAMIEKLAREELKLVKPGDVVLLSPNENPPAK